MPSSPDSLSSDSDSLFVAERNGRAPEQVEGIYATNRIKRPPKEKCTIVPKEYMTVFDRVSGAPANHPRRGSALPSMINADLSGATRTFQLDPTISALTRSGRYPGVPHTYTNVYHTSDARTSRPHPDFSGAEQSFRLDQIIRAPTILYQANNQFHLMYSVNTPLPGFTSNLEFARRNRVRPMRNGALEHARPIYAPNYQDQRYSGVPSAAAMGAMRWQSSVRTGGPHLDLNNMRHTTNIRTIPESSNFNDRGPTFPLGNITTAGQRTNPRISSLTPTTSVSRPTTKKINSSAPSTYHQANQTSSFQHSTIAYIEEEQRISSQAHQMLISRLATNNRDQSVRTGSPQQIATQQSSPREIPPAQTLPMVPTQRTELGPTPRCSPQPVIDMSIQATMERTRHCHSGQNCPFCPQDKRRATSWIPSPGLS